MDDFEATFTDESKSSNRQNHLKRCKSLRVLRLELNHTETRALRVAIRKEAATWINSIQCISYKHAAALCFTSFTSPVVLNLQ